MVSQDLQDAPTQDVSAKEDDDSFISQSRKLKYDFIRKKPTIEELRQQEHKEDLFRTTPKKSKKYLFISFGDIHTDTPERFDVDYPPTLNFVVNDLPVLKQRSFSPPVFAPSHKVQIEVECHKDDHELQMIDAKYQHDPSEDSDFIHVNDKDYILPFPKHSQKRYFDFSKARKNHSIVISPLANPKNSTIKPVIDPITTYSLDLKKTIRIISDKNKNMVAFTNQKRLPHQPAPVIDCHESLAPTIKFHALDNSQKLLREQLKVFKEQQKGGALEMVEESYYDELRKDTPSTDLVRVGDKTLSIAIEQ